MYFGARFWCIVHSNFSSSLLLYNECDEAVTFGRDTTFMQLNIHSTVIYVYKIADHACDDEKTMLNFKQAKILIELSHNNVNIKKGWIMCSAFVKCTSIENLNSMKAGGAAAECNAIWWNNRNYVNVYH